MRITGSDRRRSIPFEATGYVLGEKILEIPITLRRGPREGTGERAKTTFGELYSSLRNSKGSLREALAKQGFERLEGVSRFCTDVLMFVSDLLAEDIEAFSGVTLMSKGYGDDSLNAGVELFFYDKDTIYSPESGKHLSRFFVVSGAKIICERASFAAEPEDGFDAAMFVSRLHARPSYSSENEWIEAEAQYWYNKFYTETFTGQLMVLRRDKPTLYYYPRSGAAKA